MSDDPYYTAPVIGSMWSGAGEHKGHTITYIENRQPRVRGAVVSFDDGETPSLQNATVEFVDGRWDKIFMADGGVIDFDGRHIRVENGVLTCGRIRCSCTQEWDVGGWPRETGDILVPKS